MSPEAKTLPENLSEAISRLIIAEHIDNANRIILPLSYPSGAPVEVEVQANGDDCFVTDRGGAANEADLMGSRPSVFTQRASEIAEQYGIGFNNRSFFAVRVPLARIEGAISTVGSASLKSVILTEEKMLETRDQDAREALKFHLREKFGARNFTEDFEMIGISSHIWRFAGRVITVRGPSVFDTVSPAPVSVFAATSKFSDISGLETPPNRVAAVTGGTIANDYKNLLQRHATIIPLNSPASIYFEAAGKVA